ncbi:unnamed protein product, partial [Brassica oleracea var. botrytis]
MSGPLEWIVSKKSLGIENGLHRVITASQLTGLKDINLATSTYLGAKSMVAHLRVCERSWKYDGGTLYDSLGVTHVSFRGIQGPLFPREKTMDPVVPNKEIVHLYSPICLHKLVVFQTVAKLSSEVSFMDVMFVIYPTSSTWLVYFSRGSLQNFVILGVDMSYCRHQHVCAPMRLDDIFLGKRKEKIQLEWMSLMGNVVFYVGDLMAVGEDEHVKVQIMTCLVSFIKFLCVRFSSRWKHVDLNGRLEAFDMIQFIWVFGAYNTVTFLELPRSTALWPLCIHMNVISSYDILRSSAVWPLSNVDVTVPLIVFPSQWLQMELQWGVSKSKVEGLHSPQTAAYFLTLKTEARKASTTFSMVVWDISRSVGRELICGVMINIFKSTQRQLPNKNARKILFDNVTRCTFLVGWDLIHSIVVSYESLELHDEENCRYPYERLMPARGYFWLLTIVDKGSFPCSPWIHKPLSSKSTTMSFVFCPTTSIQAACYCDLSMDTRDHTFTVILDTLVGRFVISRKFAIHSGDLQLVHVTKSVFLASRVQSSLIHRGNRSLFVIVEGKLFSFVKPLWSSLALESVYSHIHLLPFLSSLHELHRGILKSEFDVVRLMNLEFVAASSAQKVVRIHQSPTFRVKHENISLCGFMIAFVLLCDCFRDNFVYGLTSTGPLAHGIAPDFKRNSVRDMRSEGSYGK